MIDLHCHYLPGIDDGAQTLEEGLALARAAVADGIVHAVMTPHLHPGVFDNSAQSIQPVFEAFKQALVEHDIALQVSLGGEVRLGLETLESALRGELPCLGTWAGEPVVLIEFPHEQIPVGAERALAHLRQRGIVPMIAHPERNKGVMRDWRRMESFVKAGCLTQVTAGSICGDFGTRCKDLAEQLLGMDWVTVVASDAHNLEHRPPVMRRAHEELERQYGATRAGRLTLVRPAQIVGAGVGTAAGTRVG
jgi:protein-tyrosine phosphatase